MFTVFKTVLVDRLPIAAQDRVIIMHPLDRSGRHLDVPESYLPEIARNTSLFRGLTGVYHLVRPQPFMNEGDVVVTSGNFLIAAESRLRSGADYWGGEP